MRSSMSLFILWIMVGMAPAGAAAAAATAGSDARVKLHPQLREVLTGMGAPSPGGQTASDAETYRVMVTARPGTDLSAYLTGIIATNVLLEDRQDFYGMATATGLEKLASLPEVFWVIPVNLERDGPLPIDPEAQESMPPLEDWQVLQANADNVRRNARPWSEARALGDEGLPPALYDFFEIKTNGPHKAEAAWARGFDGTGVTVAVLDDGVDWAHPDLMGRQRIYTTTLTGGQDVCGPLGCAAAYNGWPMAYSPYSLYLYVSDHKYGTHYIANGYSAIHYADTSETPALRAGASGSKLFDYTPWQSYGVRGTQHTYIVAATMTKSGTIHAGTHPDESIRDYIWGAKVAVLVCDPNTSGVYDTVYVDLDNDFDFRDEKPLTRADPANASTTNNMIAYRDLDGDGKADLSGGALYFIADGQTPIPHSWVRYSPADAPAPGNGNLVAFDGPWTTGYSHGTQCASDVVGQGKINGLVPSFSDLGGDGKPTGAVFGAAKKSTLVDVSNVYNDFNNSKIAAYYFAAYGYDGQPMTSADGSVNAADTDGIQITSNSYGTSSQDNDGWEADGRYLSQLVRQHARYQSVMHSTGNGGPGYGTVNAPYAATCVMVGASTLFGSTGWDSTDRTSQIQFNDVIPFSNRGPSARGTAGVDVVADGAYAAGDEALNHYTKPLWGTPDGNRSWDTWGGTSRSCPVAAGNMALVYQAFKAKYKRWPWWDEARAILKSTATDLNYDVLAQGSGSVNADRGTGVAAGWYGVYVTPDEWNPGNYRGTDYPAFAHVLGPNQTSTRSFTVKNTGIKAVTVTVGAVRLERIGSQTATYSITPAMFAAKNEDNSLKAPQFIVPLTATSAQIAANSWWDNIDIPAGTELMSVTARYPYNQLDPDSDYYPEDRFRMAVYNWKDLNVNHKVWNDKNGNGVVNYVLAAQSTQADGIKDLVWNDPAAELDKGEYTRFGYGLNHANILQMWVHDPLTRMQDGIFLGFGQAGDATVQQTDFTIRYDFFKSVSATWLTVAPASLSISAGISKTFNATVNTASLAPGIYQAAIEVTDPGGTISGTVAGPNGNITIPSTAFPKHVTVVPVVLCVAPDFTEGMTFGGAAQAAAQAADPYNNALVGGHFNWSWRAESGDWRFFFFDNKTTPAAGTKLLVRDVWTGTAPHTDIDTLVFGPASDAYSGVKDAEPAYYGPYTLTVQGKSPNTNFADGRWRFNTSSGGAEDWVTAPFASGLHLLAQHNVLVEGDAFDATFTKTVGTIRATPATIHLWTFNSSGSVPLSIQSGLTLPDLQASGYGLGSPVETTLDIGFTDAGSVEYWYPFTVDHASKVVIDTSSPDIGDVDLTLYYWTGSAWNYIAGSAGSSAAEHIEVVFPADGPYSLGINNYSGPAGTVRLVTDIVEGHDLTVAGTTSNSVPAGTPVPLTVGYSASMTAGQDYSGLVMTGPTPAPGALEIPVTIHFGRFADAYIPAVAHTPGANGTAWKSDVDLFNPGTEDRDVTLALFVKNQANLNPATATVSVPAGRAVRLNDILNSTFSTTNAAIGVRYPANEILVNSRFYNTAPKCNNGTFGMYIPAYDAAHEIVNGSGRIGVFHHLSYTPGAQSGYRTNIGFANASGMKITVKIVLYGDTGTNIGQMTQPLEAYEHRQITEIHKFLNTVAVTHGHATVEVLTAGGMAHAYAMVIDNISGDPVYMPPDLVQKAREITWDGPEVDEMAETPADSEFSADGAYDLYIPAAAHNSGVNAEWRTDVDLLNMGTADAAVDIALLRKDQANLNPTLSRQTIPAGRTLRIPDILGTVFQTGNAALGIKFISGTPLVNARFYNNSLPCSGGTFGMSVPSAGSADALTGDGVSLGVFHMVSYSTNGNLGYRTNIGFVSASAVNVDVVIRLYGDDNALIGEKPYTLRPYEHHQFSKIHLDFASPNVNAGYATVEVLTPGGSVHPYCMLIDNKTNDPIYMGIEIVTTE